MVAANAPRMFHWRCRAHRYWSHLNYFQYCVSQRVFALCFGVILIKTDRQAMRDAAHTIILEIALLYLHGIHTACADSSTGGAYIKYVACDYFNASADESMISYRLKEQKKNKPKHCTRGDFAMASATPTQRGVFYVKCVLYWVLMCICVYIIFILFAICKQRPYSVCRVYRLHNSNTRIIQTTTNATREVVFAHTCHHFRDWFDANKSRSTCEVFFLAYECFFFVDWHNITMGRLSFICGVWFKQCELINNKMACKLLYLNENVIEKRSILCNFREKNRALKYDFILIIQRTYTCIVAYYMCSFGHL